jgi:hypothetical protein
VAWNRRREFKLVARGNVRRLTGLEPEELLRNTHTQELISVDDTGARVEFVRLPVDLLLENTRPPDV